MLNLHVWHIHLSPLSSPFQPSSRGNAASPSVGGVEGVGRATAAGQEGRQCWSLNTYTCMHNVIEWYRNAIQRMHACLQVAAAAWVRGTGGPCGPCRGAGPTSVDRAQGRDHHPGAGSAMERWRIVRKDTVIYWIWVVYRYVCRLRTFCDINTSREQSMSVTHEAKYEMQTHSPGFRGPPCRPQKNF